MKRWSIFTGFLFLIALTACGSSNPTSVAPLSAQVSTTVTATVVLPASTPTPTLPPSTPTTTAAPANLRADNFPEFAQTRSFFQVIEAALGGDLFAMRLDAVALSPDGRYAALGGCTVNSSGSCQASYTASDSFLIILDTHTGELVATVPETDTDITSLAFTPDGEQLVYAASPVRIVVWDIPSGQVERVVWQEATTYSSPSVSVSPDGDQIAAVYSGGLIVWETDSGAEITQQPAARYGSALPQYSSDGSRLAVFTRDDGGEIAVYDTASWLRISLIQLPYETRVAALSPDGTMLVTIEDTLSAEVLFWDVDSGVQGGSLGASLDYTNSLTFSPDGELLLVSSWPSDDNIYDGLTVWDVAARQQLGSLPNLNIPRRVLFSADGTSILMVDNVFPIVYRWSLPDDGILAVRQTTLDFLAALQDGDYETAAGLYEALPEDLDYFESLGLDSSDQPVMLETLCAQSSQPCALQMDEILFEGQAIDGSYGLMLSFTTPDGAQYVDNYGESMFWFYASLDDSGSASFMSLPSFLYGQ